MAKLKNKKFASLKSILKQVFFFFPGVFLLYHYSIGFVVTQGYGHVPHNRKMILITALFAFFMCWFGLGSIRNLKHFIIPFSVILVGSVIGFIDILFGIGLNLNDGSSLWFLPLALVAPFIIKYRLDGIKE